MNRIRICIGGPGACPEPADSSSLQARPVSAAHRPTGRRQPQIPARSIARQPDPPPRSEEHTSELQSPCNLVCRLLLEKKKTIFRPTSQKYIQKSIPVSLTTGVFQASPTTPTN